MYNAVQGSYYWQDDFALMLNRQAASQFSKVSSCLHRCTSYAIEPLVHRRPFTSRSRDGNGRRMADALTKDETRLSNSANGKTSSSSPIKHGARPSYPVSGVIGIVKPSGPTSMSLLDALKPLLASSSVFRIEQQSDPKQRRKRRRAGGAGGDRTPKLGQGGTLDPLADGVLVLGIGSGTKHLQQFLECTKEYRTVGLLGTSTLSYDSQEPVLQRKSFAHVTEQIIREAILHFQGKQEQLPPLYSSIRIDGKRLFDYAREGKDLPRAVDRRAIDVQQIRLNKWMKAGEHAYKQPEHACTADERKIAMRARRLAGLESSAESDAEEEAAEGEVKEGENGNAAEGKFSDEAMYPAFTLDMTVSSGTYVRSIVHDVGAKVGSAAHVVKLTRLRQGQWIVPSYDGFSATDEQTRIDLREAVPWNVLQEAIDALHAKQKARKQNSEQTAPDVKNEDREEQSDATHDETLQEWEKILLDR